MTTTTVSSRQFNQDIGKAKRAARRGPVFITDRGRRTHVLMSIEQYEALAGPASIVDLLALPGAEKIRFRPPKARKLTRTVAIG